MGRKRVGTSSGAPVRLSVSLDLDTWKRLRALVLVRETSIQDLVSALVTREVGRVRLPSESGETGPAG